MAKMPDEATQTKHSLTHLTYATWCKERVEHQARPVRHERTGGLTRGSISEVIFFATLAREIHKQSQQEQYVCGLVVIDSQTGYIHVAPIRKQQEPISSHCGRVDEVQSFVGVFSHHLQE